MDVIQQRLREEFAQVVAAQAFRTDDLVAGRAYIKAYVEFIHFVERLYDSTVQSSHGHFDDSDVRSKDH